MTVQIPLSQAKAIGFEAKVAAYIRALEEHRFTGNAAPTAEPIIQDAVRRVQYDPSLQKPDDFEPDYEIVDDTPPPAPEPTLEERKSKLVQESRQQEARDLAALMPPGKMRLLQMDAAAANSKPENERTGEEMEKIAALAILQAEMQKIARAGAQREAAIDDMRE